MTPLFLSKMPVIVQQQGTCVATDIPGRHDDRIAIIIASAVNFD
jgi:hypothetical protein